MSFMWPFLLGPAFFRMALSCSGGYHLEWGGINCEKGAGAQSSPVKKIKSQVSSIWAKVCMLDFVCVI